MWKVLWCGARELCCWLHARLRHALHIAKLNQEFASFYQASSPAIWKST